jgi:hypothetical protein
MINVKFTEAEAKALFHMARFVLEEQTYAIDCLTYPQRVDAGTRATDKLRESLMRRKLNGQKGGR